MRFPSLLLLALLTACSSLTARVQGKVVDDKNQPVAGARISLGMYPGESEPEPESWLESDANGEFDGLITFRHKSGSPIRALDPGGKWGGTAHISRHRNPVTITVYPLMKVQGRVNYEKIPKSLREWNERNAEGFRGRNVLVRRRLAPVDGRMPPPEYVASCPLTDGRFEFLLPAGDYELIPSGLHEPLKADFTVKPGVETDLGILEARPNATQSLYDAPAPELKLADARGIPRDFQWSSMRGRWVILYFWDHRNLANQWLPGLVERWNAWGEHREKFEIIAVHNSDAVPTVMELERMLQWHSEYGRDLKIPFPVAIDDGEGTFNAYAITRGLPRRGNRIVVINPEGRVEFTQGLPPTEYVRRKLEPQNP